jgi:hypothetical protein
VQPSPIPLRNPTTTRRETAHHIDTSILRRALTVALIVLSLSTAGINYAGAQPLPPSDGGIGIRLVDAPVSARDDPRAMVYIVDHLAPGTVIDRRVEVFNTTGAPTKVSLYTAAAQIQDGSFVGSLGQTPNELSTWVSLNPADHEIGAGESVLTNVTISVPADAAPGEQYGVIWAEMRSAPSAGGVTQVSRVGVRVYLSVGPGNAPAADFVVDSLSPGRTADGQPVVTATVRNVGGRAIDMSGTLSLAAGPGGLSAGPFPAVLGATLAPGDTGPVTITLDKQLPAGPWDAEISLRSGLVERSANATITFPDSGMSEPVATSTGSMVMVAATTAVIVVLVLICAYALWIWRRHNRQTAQPSRGDRAHPAD